MFLLQVTLQANKSKFVEKRKEKEAELLELRKATDDYTVSKKTQSVRGCERECRTHLHIFIDLQCI